METKEQDGEKSITIFLQAHGSSLTNSHIPLDDSIHCEILSFTGSVGKTGTMKKKCDGIIIPPDESNGLPEIRIDGAQLDVMALSYVQQVYTHISQNPAIDNNIKSEFSFNIVVNGIPAVYSNCGVTRFPYFKKFNTQIDDEPFLVIPPLQDKEYQLHPNAHEECSNRAECIRNGGCELLPKSEQMCPFYGIYIVYSSNEEDNQYTLSGAQAQDGNDIIANLNSEESHDGETIKFWEDKINNHWEHIIRNEMDEGKKSALLREKTYITKLYHKLTRTLDSYTPTSDKMIMDDPLPVILLSELLTIFIKGMGYDKINIIDPSCDTCQKLSRFKLAANIALRDVRRRLVNKFRAKRGITSVNRKRGLTTFKGRPVTIVRGGKRRGRNRKTQKKKCKKVSYKRRY